jgi:hypothetical protein
LISGSTRRLHRCGASGCILPKTEGLGDESESVPSDVEACMQKTAIVALHRAESVWRQLSSGIGISFMELTGAR